LILGTALGAALPLGLHVPYRRFLDLYLSDDDLFTALLMHLLYWGTLGAVGGMAFALGAGLKGRAVARLALAGLVGACLGAGIFEVAGGTLDPLAGTSEPVSRTWTTRLLARVLVGLGAGLGVAVGLAGTAAGTRPEGP
jgi:hypothetical protein